MCFNGVLQDGKDWQSLMFFGSVIHNIGPTFENIWSPALTEFIVGIINVNP